jgi:hypothetical protein
MNKLHLLLYIIFSLLFIVVLGGCTSKGEITDEPLQTVAEQTEDQQQEGTKSHNETHNEDNSHQEKQVSDDHQDDQQPAEEPQVITENRVRITLDNEIQLSTHLDDGDLLKRGFLTTLLSAKKEHTFIIHFLQDMDQSQVESLLQDQLSDQIEFNWSGAQRLHLTFPPFSEEKLTEHPRSLVEKKIALDGALTANGEILQDQSTFYMMMGNPNQLWRVSADENKKIEVMSNFNSLYNGITPLHGDRYWLLSNGTEYCECDREYPIMFYLYDHEQQSIQYLGTFNDRILNYQGEGPIWIDNRGFFLKKGAVQIADPNNQWLYQPKGYVQGAAFLQDGSRIVLALGEDNEDRNLDLVLLDLQTKEEQVYPNVIPGFHYNEMTGAHAPTPFFDNGKHIYFHVSIAEDQNPEKARFYRFDPKTGKAEPYESSVGFIYPKYSHDHQYVAHPNDGIYQSGEKIHALNVWEFYWSPTDNRIFVDGYDTKQDKYLHDIISMNPYEKQHIQVPEHFEFQGWSEDGKWLYYFGQ